MEYDTDKVDQVVLALLSLTLHDVESFGGRAWKGHDWDVLDRLHQKGWISNPATKAQSVVLSPEAIEESKRLFDHFFKAPAMIVSTDPPSASEHAFADTWHIYEMEMWDADYFNMEEQAHLEIDANLGGHFQFGLVNGHLHGHLEPVDGTTRLAFTWGGRDEMEPVNGRGWMRLDGAAEAVGMIAIHQGDRSTFRARRADETNGR